MRNDIMYQLVFDKLENDETLKALLLATGDRELIEGNHWNDRYWGVCRGVGQNWLGKTLMRVRSELSARHLGI